MRPDNSMVEVRLARSKLTYEYTMSCTGRWVRKDLLRLLIQARVFFKLRQDRSKKLVRNHHGDYQYCCEENSSDWIGECAP